MSQHAPVVLFVYNRPKHTERTLETLRLCRMASESELYVFADGPKHDADSDDMLKIKRTRELVQGATGFANVHMATREKNLGLYQSVVRGVGEVLREHDKVIVLEDDLVVSRSFLEFMNRSLDLNQTNAAVTSVSGYAYNLPFKFLRPRNYYLRAFSCLGWGTWQDRWEQIRFHDQATFERLRASRYHRFLFDIFGGMDYFRRLESNRDAELATSWAIEFGLAQFQSAGMQLFPRENLVFHIGYDSSGTHSTAINPWNDPELDPEAQAPLFPARAKVRLIDQLALSIFFYRERTRLFLRHRLRLDR